MSMDLLKVYNALREPLEGLGNDLDLSILQVWIDRERHGEPPLPRSALESLRDVLSDILAGKFDS